MSGSTARHGLGKRWPEVFGQQQRNPELQSALDAFFGLPKKDEPAPLFTVLAGDLTARHMLQIAQFEGWRHRPGQRPEKETVTGRLDCVRHHATLTRVSICNPIADDEYVVNRDTIVTFMHWDGVS